MILDAGSSVRGGASLYDLGRTADLGSQGTRAHIYRWLHNSIARKEADKKALHSLPKLETKKKWTKKIKPGGSIEGG